MTAVLGLDLSTKRTGVALPTGRCTSLVFPKNVGGRLHFLAGWLGGALRLYAPNVIVVEDYPIHTYPRALAAAAKLHAVVELVAYEYSMPVVAVGPSQLKRWATGNGGADKVAMVAAARTAGATVANDDEADAWLLRALGVMGMGGGDLLDGEDLGHRLEVVAAITWPVIG